MEKIKEDLIDIEGGKIPVSLFKDENVYSITVDGVLWLYAENRTHAIVMYHMMREHLTEYMHYEMR